MNTTHINASPPAADTHDADAGHDNPAPPDTPAQALQPPAPRIEVEGRVSRPSELRISPGGGFAHLIVTLAQPKRNGRADPPITATYSGDAYELPAMEALSWRLLPGVAARLVGYGMDYNADRRALKLNACISVRELRAGGEVGLSVAHRATA